MKGYFVYRPLNLSPNSRQIRLLKLLPAKSLDDDIRCTIFHTSLDDSPSYEALSYVWGSEDNPSSIFVRYHPQYIAGASQQHEAEDRDTSLDHCLQLGVTHNLHDALRHIRLPGLERIMWVDAICINQKQDSEKNHQVNLMRQIYLASNQVVLRLGKRERLGNCPQFPAENGLATKWMCRLYFHFRRPPKLVCLRRSVPQKAILASVMDSARSVA